MKSIYCILIANLIVISTSAQQNVEVKTHYLFPKFTQGVVLKKSGIKNNASLNYNSVTEEMIFDKNGTKLAIPKTELQLIDTVFIKDAKFIVLNDKFVEIVHHSKWDLYAEHRCKMKDMGKSAGLGGNSELSAINSHSSILVGAGLYELELPDNYKIEPYTYYWLKKDGEPNKFVTMSKLKKLYKGKDDLFKAYVKKNDVKYDNQEGIIDLIEYLESN